MSIYIFRSISQSIDIDSHSVQVSPFQGKKLPRAGRNIKVSVRIEITAGTEINRI